MIESFIHRDPNPSGNTPNLKSNHYDSLGSDRVILFSYLAHRVTSPHTVVSLYFSARNS